MNKFEFNKGNLIKESPEVETNTEDKGVKLQYDFINELVDKAELPNELKQLIKQQEIIYIEKDKLENEGNSIKSEKEASKLNNIDKELEALNRNTEYITNKIRGFIDQNQELRQEFEALIRELKGRRKILNPEDSSQN